MNYFSTFETILVAEK